jgi:hypothetical protein
MKLRKAQSYAFDARQAGKYRQRRAGEIDRLPPRLAVGQKENAALYIDEFPASVYKEVLECKPSARQG